MTNTLQIFFRSFFDFAYIKENYIKNGKGTGTFLLFIEALALSILATVYVFIRISTADEAKLQPVIEAGFRSVELDNITIKDGEFQYKDNVVKNFSPDDRMNITIDTTTNDPSLSKVQESVIYITKTKLIINDGKGKLQDISFSDIQSLTGENPLVLDSQKLASWLLIALNFVKWFAVVAILVFGSLIFWAINNLYAYISVTIAAMFNSSLNKVFDFKERKRLAAVSVLPVLVVVDLLTLSSLFPFGFPWRFLIIVICGVLIINGIYLSKDKGLDKIIDSH